MPTGDEITVVRGFLKILNVPVSSQMLVYSATSRQRIISPHRPRALYFNEDLYIDAKLSPNDIVQSNLTYYTGHGYYSDPYKTLDTRPTERQTWAWLTRYNHHFAQPDATLQLGYRYLNDSFGGDSSTFDVAWVQSLAWGVTLTP